MTEKTSQTFHDSEFKFKYPPKRKTAADEFFGKQKTKVTVKSNKAKSNKALDEFFGKGKPKVTKTTKKQKPYLFSALTSSKTRRQARKIWRKLI